MYSTAIYPVVDVEVLNAPFSGYADNKGSLLKMGAVKVNNAPCDEVIGCMARVIAVMLTDDYIYGFHSDDYDLYAIYETLLGFWERKDIHAMYFYIALISIGSIKYVPKELIRVACREDLLNLFMKHFIKEFEILVNCAGDGTGDDE